LQILTDVNIFCTALIRDAPHSTKRLTLPCEIRNNAFAHKR